MALQDLQVHQEKESKANRGHQVYKVSKERKVIRVYRETQVWMGQLDPQDFKENQAGTALME